MVTNFEIFRMREKQVPVDVVEMKGKNMTNRKNDCCGFRIKIRKKINRYFVYLPFQKAS